MSPEKETLLTELKNKFDSLKKELSFSSTFEEINEIFRIDDCILSASFVSERFSRQLCARIVETCMSWLNYLQGLMFPNTGNLISLNENRFLGEPEKKEVGKIVGELMALATTNTVIGLTKDKTLEAKFIDDAVSYWNNSFTPRITPIIKKINNHWKE